jgi:hypothetical protein
MCPVPAARPDLPARRPLHFACKQVPFSDAVSPSTLRDELSLSCSRVSTSMGSGICCLSPEKFLFVMFAPLYTVLQLRVCSIDSGAESYRNPVA